MNGISNLKGNYPWIDTICEQLDYSDHFLLDMQCILMAHLTIFNNFLSFEQRKLDWK